MIGIYIIRNLLNDKVYIGQSVDIESRLWEHRTNYHNAVRSSNSHLQNSIQKYGVENFSFEILEECTRESLNDREVYWISYYKSNEPEYGYNKTSGGSSGYHYSKDVLERRDTPEWREKLSNYRKSHQFGKDNPMYGKHHTEEHKEYLSSIMTGNPSCANYGERNPMYGKHHSDEVKNYLSSIRKGKIFVNNGGPSILIDPIDLEEYLSQGYVRGRAKKMEVT